MKYIFRKYKSLKDVIEYFTKSIENYETLSISEKCEMLLCFQVLGIEKSLLRDKLQEINAYDVSNDNIVKILKRHLVLLVFGLNEEERLQFIKHWLIDEFYKEEDIVTVAWIFGILVDDIDLLDESERNKIQIKLKKLAKNITAQTSLSWMPFHLEKFGYYNLANKIIDKLVSETEANGSWVGNVSRTARILYALHKSDSSKNRDFKRSFDFIESRLSKGIDLDTKLTTQIIKLYYITGKLNSDFRDIVVETLNINSINQIDVIMSLLGENKIDQALKIMDIHDLISSSDLTLIKSRVSNMKDSFNKGMISIEDKNIERQNIIKSLIDIVN